MNALVKDVMTSHVHSVTADATFVEVADALRRYRVSAFPVLDKTGKVAGVVSESDLLAKLALGSAEEGLLGVLAGILHQRQMEKARAVTAGDLMTSPPATVFPDDTVEHAAQLMYHRKIKRLPVVDDAGRLTGIVSRVDLLAVYGRPDVEIGEQVRHEILLTESLADDGTFDVSVADGVVTLSGSPRTPAQGHDIVRRVRHLQGVVAVRDRFDYPAAEPDHFDVLTNFPID